MSAKYYIGIIFSFLILFSDLQAQFWKRKTNRFNEDGKRQGLWIHWWDEENNIKMSVARYKEGRECGASKEYHQNGNLRLKMRYYRNRVRVKYFYENGKLEQKGWAVLDYNPEDTHYYWHGKWKFYDESRKWVESAIYINGEEDSRTLHY